MNREKLEKLRQWAKDLRRQGGIKSADMEGLAQALGRKRHKRGKEPTWISEKFTDLRPVTIPHHSRDLNRFTALHILDQLEDDLDRYETEATKKERGAR